MAETKSFHPDIATFDQRVAEEKPTFSDSDDITNLFGKAFSASGRLGIIVNS